MPNFGSAGTEPDDFSKSTPIACQFSVGQESASKISPNEFGAQKIFGGADIVNDAKVGADKVRPLF